VPENCAEQHHGNTELGHAGTCEEAGDVKTSSCCSSVSASTTTMCWSASNTTSARRPQSEHYRPGPSIGIPVDVCEAIARDRLPRATFTILPGLGHTPTIDDPELVASTILAVTEAEGAAAQGGDPDV
jgi:hypothetical protein